MTTEEKLISAAIHFGAWQKQAYKSKKLEDRVQYVRAETALLEAAQVLFEKAERRHRVKNRRSKG